MRRPAPHATPNKQRGVALMVMLVVLIMGIAAVLVSSLSTTALRNEQQQRTAETLAQAKEALIGYAVTSENAGGATARPGNFPCPDTDAPGTAGYGDENASCVSGAIGRLPWKTLGLPELLDGDGEPLWYALSGNFRKSTSMINSDTRGTLLVYDRDGSTLLTPSGSEAVAIIFSPGKIIGSQQRSSNADKVNATNYLDAAQGRNNAVTDGPFIAADNGDAFNDKLAVIRTREFMPTIEKRVAKELKTILENYRADNGVYPYPASFNTCYTNSTCTSNINICRGRWPYTALPQDWGGSYSLPQTASGSSWFVNNRWFRVIYYSAGTSRLNSAPFGCSTTLTVSGIATSALFFMPGTPIGSVTRTYPNNNLSWYLENAWNQNQNDNYVTPSTNSNDQLYKLP